MSKPIDKEAIYDKLVKLDHQVSRTEEEIISRLEITNLPERIQRFIAEKNRLRNQLNG